MEIAVENDILDRADSASVEGDCYSQQRTQLGDDRFLLFGEILEILVFLFRGAFAVVASDIGDDIDFGFGITEQFAIPNQIVGVLVMGIMTDKVTAIVQDGGTPEQLPNRFVPSV